VLGLFLPVDLDEVCLFNLAGSVQINLHKLLGEVAAAALRHRVGSEVGKYHREELIFEL